MTETTTTIEVEGLTCRYGGFTAVSDLGLRVERGEIFALLGTNGAGKTTTLETIEGYRRPTAGTVRVFGHDPSDRRRVRPRVGIMLQESGLAGDLTVAETVRLGGTISGRSDDENALIGRVGLAPKSGTRVTQLSGGEKRRLDFALAVYGSPDLVFLDEPTTGLDPAARDLLWAQVRALRARGTTVVLTTHYLGEAQEHADRIALMHAGRIARQGTVAELVGDQPSRISFVAPGAISDLPLVVHGTDNELVVIETRDLQSDLTRLLRWADESGVRLERLSATTSTLDDVFRSLGSTVSA